LVDDGYGEYGTGGGTKTVNRNERGGRNDGSGFSRVGIWTALDMISLSCSWELPVDWSAPTGINIESGVVACVHSRHDGLGLAMFFSGLWGDRTRREDTEPPFPHHTGKNPCESAPIGGGNPAGNTKVNATAAKPDQRGRQELL